MPKISFLVTYYNQQQYVKQSLDSILAINFPKNCEYEILIGDDGSTDSTVKEIQRYIEQYPDRINLYVMPRENGVNYNPIMRASANRLNLLSRATGDYFCILDGDDWYCDKDFIAEGVKILEGDKSLSVCALAFQFVTDRECKKSSINIPEGKISACVYLLGAYTPAGACLLRRVYSPNQIEYMKHIGYFDDNNIVIANLNFGDMFFIDRVIYSYRQTGVSIWTSITLFERNTINALDYDINIKYGNKYPNEIKQRHLRSLNYVYNNRKDFLNMLGKEKAEKYLSMVKAIPDSMFYKIINYDQLTIEEKKSIKLFLYIPVTKKIKSFSARIYRKIFRKEHL